MRVVYPWQPRRENEVNTNNVNIVRENRSKMVEVSCERGFESKGQLLNVRQIGN